MKNYFLITLLLSTLAITACSDKPEESAATAEQIASSSTGSESAGQPRLEKMKEAHGFVTVEPEGSECRASLSVRQEDKLYWHDDCKRSRAEKLKILDQLGHRLFAEGKLPDNIVSVYMGRMMITSPDMACDWAKAAAIDPKWQSMPNPQRRSTAAYAVATGIAISAPVYPGVAEWASRHGRQIETMSIEKMLTAEPSKIPLEGCVFPEGTDEKGYLPFDALTWLSLDHIPEPTPVPVEEPPEDEDD